MINSKHPTNRLERLREKVRHTKPKKKGSSIRRAKEKEILDDIQQQAIADIKMYRDGYQP